jgi:hypothetical protein
MNFHRQVSVGALLVWGVLLGNASPPADDLTPEEMAQAIVIDHPNDRRQEVEIGEDVTYRIRNTDTFLRVFGETATGRAGMPAPVPGSVTYTQVCGVNVYLAGLRVAELRNRANVTYFTGQTRAPARFNWMDMKGTRTLSLLFTWSNLNQSSSPGLGVTFQTYGHTQASGNLTRCIQGLCRTDYFVSRLVVKTSGTTCQ